MKNPVYFLKCYYVSVKSDSPCVSDTNPANATLYVIDDAGLLAGISYSASSR